MTVRRRYSKTQKIAAVVAAEMTNATAAAETSGVPESTIRYWLDKPQFAELRAKTREQAAEGFTVLMHAAQERLHELLPTMEARDVVILAGVAAEKAQLLSGQATMRTETKDVTDTLNDHEREALRKVIDDVVQEDATTA